ncbi:folate-binding protein [Candidatus Pelagibacter bacterium]|nr:folate-binding protein [Candidatus Pelagibacter bacterium]
MEKDQIIILENRGLISITGVDAKEYLQNIITNDIGKVSRNNSIFAALLSPQGKYLFDFFVIKSNEGYLLDCDGSLVKELLSNLFKYKIRSKIEIKDLSSSYVVGVINFENFKIMQKELGKEEMTLQYRDSPTFIDPRDSELGARIISPLEKLYLTIKKLNLKIVKNNSYIEKAFLKGIPIEGLNNLQNQLFGLEVNFEKLNAIDFKKGCYVGQENTARMKMKNKIRRQLMSIKSEKKLKIGDEIKYNDNIIGKVLIDKPFPFAVIKLFDPEFSVFKNKKLKINDNNVEIIS